MVVGMVVVVGGDGVGTGVGAFVALIWNNINF